MSSSQTSNQQRIAVLAFDGFDSLQVSGIIAAISSVGHSAVVIGNRKGAAYPRGVQQGDDKATGVVQVTSTIESPESFSALFIPDGDQSFISQLESEQGIKTIRESARTYQTIGAIGGAVPVVAHKALPGDTDLKADLSKPYSSKNGFVLASNLVSDEASTWQKIKGVADLGGFGFEFFDAVSKQPHKGRDISAIKA
ncbi:hypothetical protein JCM3765_005309 [Sporobolomyces pararoseus]